MKTKTEILEFLQSNPVFSLATVENGKPRVRMILLFRADERGIIFHTGKLKDLYKQLQENPEAELCFYSPKTGLQVRVSGTLIEDDSPELFDEIYNHPSRAFLRKWGDEMKDKIAVYRMPKGKVLVWTMESNFAPKQYIEI